MAPMGTIDLREASRDFSRLVERVARTGQSVVVTKRGVPLVRILPAESVGDALAAETVLLDRLLGEKLPLAPWRFDRDELYER